MKPSPGKYLKLTSAYRHVRHNPEQCWALLEHAEALAAKARAGQRVGPLGPVAQLQAARDHACRVELRSHVRPRLERDPLRLSTRVGDVPLEPTDESEVEKLLELTPREREILELLAEGLRVKQIADRLSLSPATVHTHVRNAIARMEVDTRTEAVALAVRFSYLGAGGKV